MEIPVLKQLDIVIGLAVVMLLASTTVTAIVQVLLSTSFSKVRHLRDGLQELIAQIDPVLLEAHKRYIAQRVQRHPLVSRGNTPIGWVTSRLRNWLRRTWKHVPGLPTANPGSVIQREELIGILLEWAAGEGPLADQDRCLARESTLDAASLSVVRADLKRALANGGITDPGAVLSQIREAALAQEAANPQLPLAQWRAQAVLQSASSPFTAKVFGWFDNTIARVTGNFALEARFVTSVVAFLLCWAIQLDSAALIKRLSRDDKFREAVVSQAGPALKRYEDAQKAQAAGTGAAAAPAETAKANEEIKGQIKELTDTLRDPKYDVIPSHYGWELKFSSSISGGILFSGILVSLGAPFWYDLLKRLLGLRSLLAQKDDGERKDRQESQQPPNTPAANPVPQITVLSDQPDLVEIRQQTVLRTGSPSASSPSAGDVAVETLVPVTGTVEGQGLTDAAGNVNKKWYRTPDGEYLWAGATDKA